MRRRPAIGQSPPRYALGEKISHTRGHILHLGGNHDVIWSPNDRTLRAWQPTVVQGKTNCCANYCSDRSCSIIDARGTGGLCFHLCVGHRFAIIIIVRAFLGGFAAALCVGVSTRGVDFPVTVVGGKIALGQVGADLFRFSDRKK